MRHGGDDFANVAHGVRVVVQEVFGKPVRRRGGPSHYQARKRASDTVTLGDLKAAFKEAVRPSERALAQTLSQAQARRERRGRKAVAMPVQTHFARDARPEINFAERQTAPVETTAD